MEKQIATFKDYAIFMADKTSLMEIAQFVVRENYSHHLSSFTEKEVNEDIKSVLEEEEYLYDNKSHIYIARDAWKSHTNLTHPGKYFRPSKVKIMRPTSPK